MATAPKVVAIGEIGLDYYWDKTYQKEQIDYFQKQMAMASDLNLPVLVHSREASADTFEILKNRKGRGVLHCYSGSLEMAREFVKMGYYLGIGGVVTFKNSKEIKRVVTEIPLEHLLTETDGPYLAPAPYRGKLNKPEYLPLIVDAISELKGIDRNIVEKSLFENAMKLFNI
jgi:TatD DNase family protein